MNVMKFHLIAVIQKHTSSINNNGHELYWQDVGIQYDNNHMYLISLIHPVQLINNICPYTSMSQDVITNITSYAVWLYMSSNLGHVNRKGPSITIIQGVPKRKILNNPEIENLYP